MQSRVGIAGHRFTIPAGLSGVAACIGLDQHEARCLPGLSGELKAATGGQGQGLRGFRDDQTHRSRPQSLLYAP